jgi:hypothetical protein
MQSLIDDAAALVRQLPPDLIEPMLGRLNEMSGRAALAWTITHFGDELYRQACANHPVGGSFSTRLQIYLQDVLYALRTGRYRLHGRCGIEIVDALAEWFVDGAVDLDMLGNAIVLANGPRLEGVEAYPVLRDLHRDDDLEAEEEEPAVLPSAAEKWMYKADAQMVHKHGEPVLQKTQAVADCMEATGATRDDARKAYEQLPRWRQRGKKRLK